jgi:thiamine-phosphate pyrophosphorylase
MKLRNHNIYRILDANFNRTREGLRVCEDIVRFCGNAQNFTRDFKAIRHSLAKIIQAITPLKQKLLRYRDVYSDVGRNMVVDRIPSINLVDLFTANMQRAQESLRVLEEISKIVDSNLEPRLRKLRFRLYSLESALFRRLLRHASQKHS